MIHGIGVDMVEIRRIVEGLDRFGPKLARRILTDTELRLYEDHPRQAGFLAKRFAAKEALVKALGTGFRDEVRLKNIGIENDELGKPVLTFSGPMPTVLQRRGILRTHLSITDERDYALAYVVLETN